MKEGDVADLRAGLARGYDDGGFRVWDIADPAHPRELAYVKTGGIGVHRFDMDERYAYISTEMAGYVGNILVIYDLADPTRPREVSRWHLPGQHESAGETPTWSGQRHRLHHALRVGDVMWAACWYAGAYAIDVSDINRPQTIGSFNYHPPYPEPTHTFFPLVQPLGGRKVALAIDEEHDHVPGQPHAFLVGAGHRRPDEDHADLHLPCRRGGLALCDGRRALRRPPVPGAAGRAASSSRPGSPAGCASSTSPTRRVPKEIGHFIPAPAAGHVAPQSNDVDVNADGIVCLLDRDCGLDILQFEG